MTSRSSRLVTLISSELADYQALHPPPINIPEQVTRPQEPIRSFTRIHSVDQLISWAKSLRYFYVFGDFESGHVWMPETLQCRIRFSDTDDFLRKISLLVDLEPTPPELPWMRFPLGILPQYLDPGECQIKNCQLNGTFLFINTGDGFFDITLHGNGQNDRQGINDQGVAGAQKLENLLEQVGLAAFVDHEIASHFNCISALNYPEEFQAFENGSR